MSGSGRGGKRKNAGRPKGEPSKMARIPESIHSEVMKLVNAHRAGHEIDFDSCIQETEQQLRQVPIYSAEFFNSFPEYQTSDLAFEIGAYFEIHYEVIKKLPRMERRVIRKMLENGA